MLGNGREDRLRQLVALEQMTDRRLVGDGVAPTSLACERTHRLNVVERFLGAGIGKSVPPSGTIVDATLILICR